MTQVSLHGLGRGMQARELDPVKDPQIQPVSWKCCQCGLLYLCDDDKRKAVPPPRNYDSFPDILPDTNDPRQPCLCEHVACMQCVLVNFRQQPIATLGGGNLRPDRLVPAGWECCQCECTRFFGQPRRRAASVYMTTMAHGPVVPRAEEETTATSSSSSVGRNSPSAETEGLVTPAPSESLSPLLQITPSNPPKKIVIKLKSGKKKSNKRRTAITATPSSPAPSPPPPPPPVRCFLAYECTRHRPVAHIFCNQCVIINKYAEPLCAVGAVERIYFPTQAMKKGPLHANQIYAFEKLRFERSEGADKEEVDAEAVRAAKEEVEAGLEAERHVLAWFRELRRAARYRSNLSLIRRTRSSR